MNNSKTGWDWIATFTKLLDEQKCEVSKQINTNEVPSHYTHAFTEQQILDIIHIMKAKETSENQITKQLLSHF